MIDHHHNGPELHYRRTVGRIALIAECASGPGRAQTSLAGCLVRSDSMPYVHLFISDTEAHFCCTCLFKQQIAFDMVLANFARLSQELRDQIWSEAAAIQSQRVRCSLHLIIC